MTSLLQKHVRRIQGTAFLSFLILCTLQTSSTAQTDSSPIPTPEADSSTIRYGLPGRRFPSRPRCPHCVDSMDVGQALLLPAHNLPLVTEESAPTLLFRLPAIQDTSTVQLSIVGPERDIVYLAEANKTNETAGIVRFDLSMLDEPPTLEANVTYRWVLSISCDPDNMAKSLDTYGAIVRLDDATFDADTHGAEPNWYRDVTALDLARRQVSDRQSDQGQAIEAEWRSLLTAVGLEQIADAPPIEFTFDSEL